MWYSVKARSFINVVDIIFNMKTECTVDGPIKTDDLHNLKEGEIFVDAESGQKFRVRKTSLPQQSIGGPYGVGDPNDRSLRRLEADVLIPQRMNEQIQRVECRVSLEDINRLYILTLFHIYELSSSLSQAKFNDPWFRQKITDEYIKERAEYRRTGKNEMERKWEDYCEYKKKRGDWADLEMSGVYWCDLCKVHLSSEALLDMHNSGKRHLKKVTERDTLLALAARSVFISGLDPEITVTESEISEALSCFGKVEKVHLDITKGKYAIVEFDQEFSAQKAIFEDKVRIGHQVVLVRARKVNFDQYESKSRICVIDIDKLISKINGSATFIEQVDILLELYCLNDAEIAERINCTQMLTAALHNYFSSDIHVEIFGSSSTSLGTKGSDIDASLFFNIPLTEAHPAGDLARNKFVLLTCDIAALRGRKVCAEEYARLTEADRVRLLNKIMNDIRKRATAPVSGQYPILDARCPLVRLTVNRKHTVDLSVDNYLGYAKSNWLRNIVCCDSSQIIRKFLVSFRFWAHKNELLKVDERQRSHFNAYILNLLCIIYLQLYNYIPPLKRAQKEVIVNGWRIDFTVDHVDLSSLTLNRLFKDPLEWSHNVSMLVSEKYIAAMRHQMMFALSRMKTIPDSFLAVLHESCSTDAGTKSSSDDTPQIHVGVCQADQCMDAVNYIFVNILIFSPAVEPFQKRPRFDDTSNELCRAYIAKRRTWEGRRLKRRQIMRECSALSNDSIALEEAVTQQISQTSEGTSLCFKTYVKQKAAECSLEFILINGSRMEFNSLIHFLQHFIPAHLSKLLPSSYDVPME
uniref:RRM domain-containing protein n=1 Tax=Onchocerca volvulus TaxID=6282 RepID=A0A8R1XVS0_ONCVO